MSGNDDKTRYEDQEVWRRFIRDRAVADEASDNGLEPPLEFQSSYLCDQGDEEEIELTESWLARDRLARRVQLDLVKPAAFPPSPSVVRKAKDLVPDPVGASWLDRLSTLATWVRPTPAFATAALGACFAAVLAFQAGTATKWAQESYRDKLAAALWSPDAQVPVPTNGTAEKS